MILLEKVETVSKLKENIFLPKESDLYEICAKNIDEVSEKFELYYHISNEIWFIKNEMGIIGIYGLREENAKIGIPWMLSVEIPTSSKSDFLRVSHRICNEWKRKYEILYNYTAVQNDISHKWLSFLGFKILKQDIVEYQNGRQFYKFMWKRGE